MGFIYKITNLTNQKSYIGKTERTPQIRWKEHCNNRKALSHLPLYKALNKYGIENFKLESIEECANSLLDEREIYWISFYNTYKKGYNCTGGGEGGILIFEEDLSKIIERYLNGERLDLLCKEFHHDYNTVKNKMIEKGIKINTQAGPDKLSKAIVQINPKTNEIIAQHKSISAAARSICPPGNNYRAIANHIGKYKNTSTVSHGFLWKTV